MEHTTLEAIHILARAVHDMDPTDSAVRDLLWQCEAELRAGLPDPMQLRARLDLMDAHAEAI